MAYAGLWDFVRDCGTRCWKGKAEWASKIGSAGKGLMTYAGLWDFVHDCGTQCLKGKAEWASNIGSAGKGFGPAHRQPGMSPNAGTVAEDGKVNDGVLHGVLR